jgi:hypothetical protein
MQLTDYFSMLQSHRTTTATIFLASERVQENAEICVFFLKSFLHTRRNRGRTKLVPKCALFALPSSGKGLQVLAPYRLPPRRGIANTEQLTNLLLSRNNFANPDQS